MIAILKILAIRRADIWSEIYLALWTNFSNVERYFSVVSFLTGLVFLRVTTEQNISHFGERCLPGANVAVFLFLFV